MLNYKKTVQANAPELKQIVDEKYYQIEYKNETKMKPRHIPGFNNAQNYKQSYDKVKNDYMNMFLD